MKKNNIKDQHMRELINRLGTVKAVAEYVGWPYDTVLRWKHNGVPKIRREFVAVKLVDLLLEDAV